MAPEFLLPHTAASDPVAALIARIARGDHEAYADIVGRYQGPLFGYLGRMGFAQAPAEDIAQETFLRAWRGLGGFDPRRAAFSTWLFAIARNLSLDEHMRMARRRETPVPDTADAVDVPCNDPGPGEALDATRRAARLRAALRRLPAADRSALALAYTQELPLQAVARIEGCTVGALKTRLHRARLRLREHLSETDDAPD